jgi:Zn-dependent M16 (insulinase) family peptidase
LPGGSFKSEQYSLPESTNVHSLGVEINSAVNFVSKIWKMPPLTPESFGLQYLISRYLSTGYLWDKVRVEGGAYGGMSVSSVSHPVFACASYRDPNLGNTLHHFEKGLQMIAAGIDQDKIDQNIIGAIGKIDSPLSPHSQGFGEAIDQMIGQTAEFRQRVRDALLTANSEKLRAIVANILNSRESIISVLGGSGAFDIAEKEGHSFRREPLIP